VATRFECGDESVRATAELMPLVASDGYSTSLLIDTRVPDHYDPAWFRTRASWRAFFHGDTVFTKSTWLSAIANFRFLQKYFPHTSSPETAQRRFPKIFRQHFFAKTENNR